uniref:F0F1 ATP synthase subunit gamma n=1 Tax=Candidatus Electrothrix sp. TaxID=2170559 RepID=UPI0040565507
SNIIKSVEKLVQQYEAEGKKVSFVTVGKKAHQALKKTEKVRASFNDIMGSFQIFNAREISHEITEAFLTGESDQVDIVYGKFHSVAVQKPEREELLPIKPVDREADASEAEAQGASGSYLYEPDPNEIMEVLLPLFLNVQVYHAMLEVGASEHAARMTAMDNATNACKDMIDELTQLYNKARQAAVTGELMDIVGGAAALEG